MIYVMDIIQACLLGGAMYSYYHGHTATTACLGILFVLSLYLRIE